ncbi:hypothetical protein [Stenotrophomonas sp. GD03958]|uniref:hypothetical protein n=1 Tax=Stenotrophomonas sp. GD03958 TaxID=2975411 RepID=UPI0024479436|nr:hypothetical protein [Stenotrophomonas sp. GD03958]MDH1192628.1 hypothetical protein [Stenotrophomonas sp. GD03958]
MFIGFRLTKRLVVNAVVVLVLARLLFMGMDGLDRFSDTWNRTFGASMPNASGLRGAVNGTRQVFPSGLDEYARQAERDAAQSTSLKDVFASAFGRVKNEEVMLPSTINSAGGEGSIYDRYDQ